jgi:hypothetical protein
MQADGGGRQRIDSRHASPPSACSGGNFRSAGEALAVDVRRERFWADAAEPTNVNGLDLAFGEQLVQKASSDP